MDDKNDWLVRVQEERGGLCERLTRLEDFLRRLEEGRVIIEKQPQKYALLLMQREVMRLYLDILDRRIEVANPPRRLTSDIAEALWR